MADGFAGQRVERRAVELALWGMPLVSVAAMRRAFFAAGAEYGDVVYWSRPADWRMQITTPNTSTYYLNITSNTGGGPVLVGHPAGSGGRAVRVVQRRLAGPVGRLRPRRR